MTDWTGTGTAATTVTYDDALSTNRDKIRFYLGDTVSGSGPKPASGNFTDDEIAGLVTAEGSWQKAVAGGFEILAGLWSQYVDTAVGPRRQSLSQTAAGYEKMAKTWRRRSGSQGRAGSRAVTRVDGYSDDIAADSV